MKKTVLIFFLISLAGAAQAKIDTSIIDTFCFVSIGYETSGTGVHLVANAFDFNDPANSTFSYLWSTGDTSQSIPLTASGTYCVTATALNTGCASSSCVTMDIDNCEIYTWLDWSGYLYAYHTGIPPYTYLWDNGETGESIPVSVGDVHCVTITDAAGCVADTCVTVEYNGLDSFCFADIYTYADSSGNITLEAIDGFIIWPPGVPGTISYQWSTGDTTSSIVVNDLGEYCVTITVDNCSADACVTLSDIGCSVTIGCDPPGTFTAFGTGLYPLTYEWSTGDVSPTIPVVVGETYCVTVTDALGCVTDTCMTADSIVIWPPDTLCDVFIEYWLTGAGVTLFANTFPFWELDYQYLWSTGETTSSIMAIPGETYCVTVTSNFDTCVASSCIDLEDMDCSDVFVICDPDGTIGAFSSGVPPFTYLWSTGDTTEFIIGENDSTYCVTITDAFDCMVDTCITAMTGPVDTLNFGNMIQGDIYHVDTNNYLSEFYGWVYLYKLDEVGLFNLLDSAEAMGEFFWSGYLFTNVDTGQYITKAVVNDAITGQEYIPTYHLNAMEWDEADIIHVDGSNVNGGPIAVYFAPIQLIGPTTLTGPGGINGVITDMNNLTGGDTRNDNGIQDVTLILTDIHDHALTFSMSNVDGEFTFDNLPYGTYHLHADYLNVSGPYAVIVISSDNPVVEVSFEVSGTDLFLDSREINLNTKIDIYPNPARDKINVKLMDDIKAESIYITDLQGRTFMESTRGLGSDFELDISFLNEGIHLIRVMTNRGMIHQKLMVLK
jgi:predicted RNA-binding protein with TRAM domain